METETRKFHIRCFSASTLKLMACVFMLIDHVGFMFFPKVMLLRYIGRLAFPIFSFFIAEGCKYTRNKLKRFLLIFVLGVVFEAVYVLYSGEVEGNVFLTFSLSILLIYCVQNIKKQFFTGTDLQKVLSLLLLAVTLIAAAAVAKLFDVDYGFAGVLAPVFVSFCDYKAEETADLFKLLDRHAIRIAAFLIGLIFLVLDKGVTSPQIWCLLAIPLLFLYNGKPGVRRFKYGFYIFYPAHLLILEAIAMLWNR